jgi:hypothetical protein
MAALPARTLDETSVRWAALLGKARSILLEGRASQANPQFAASRLSVPLINV